MTHNETPANLIELHVESMAFGGKGVARKDGKVYFVEGAIEGDHAVCEILESSTRYTEARLVSLIESSKYRGPSPCPVSDVCGGCQWQGVPYAKQLEWKKNFIINSVKRIGKVEDPLEIEILPSPKENGYRNRVFLRARLQKNGSIQIGYFKRSSRDFVPIAACPIADDRINRFLKQLLQLNFSDESQNVDFDDEMKFRLEIQDLPSCSSEEPHLLVTIYESDNKCFPINQIITKLKRLGTVKWCGKPLDLHESPKLLFETNLDRSFYTSPGIFQQINVGHNHTIRLMVLNAVRDYKPKRILDLFCGSGNLSLALADGQTTIDGVEFSKRAIDVAQFSVLQQNISHTHYYAGDTEKFLWRAAKQGVKYDLVIADPPREGMFKSLIPLMKIKPHQIIYISCDPSTLSRDLNSLCKSQYKIKKFVGLDFFPNTYHVESFVILESNS